MASLAGGAEERREGAKREDGRRANRHRDHLNAIFPQQATVERLHWAVVS